jgi:hypothetical protein
MSPDEKEWQSPDARPGPAGTAKPPTAEPPSSAVPAGIVAPSRRPLIPPPAATLGAIPTQLFPPSATDTQPYTWRGPQPRPSAVAVIAVAPRISAEAVEQAFRKLVAAAETNLQRGGRDDSSAATPADRAALRSTFEDLASEHLAPLRNLMLELYWGEAQVAWIALVRSVLQSLRVMAYQIEDHDLVAAIDGFRGALERAARPGAEQVTGAARADLMEAYRPLTRSLPRAFAGVPRALAEALVGKVEQFQRCDPAIVAAEAELYRCTLDPLLDRLKAQHQRFERAASGWTEEHIAIKRQARRDRERAYLALRAILARLGEVDLVTELEKLPFAGRIEEVARFLRQPAQPAGETPAAAGEGDTD